MAYQTGTKRPDASAPTVKTKGHAPNTGAPGPTPAPTTADMARMKDTAYGRTSYGANAYAGRVVADPGKSVTSPLADELKRVNAKGDGGDHLQDIIEHGSARDQNIDLLSPQLRKIDASGYAPAFGMKAPSVGPKIPAKLGASETPLPRDQNAGSK